MLDTLLDRVPSGADAVVTPLGAVRGDALRDEVRTLAPLLTRWRGARVALACRPLPQTFAALVALERSGVQGLLADDALLGDEALMRQLDIVATMVPAADGPPVITATGVGADSAGTTPSDDGVVLLTSGTAGRPKPVRRSWKSLVAGARATSPHRWGCGYRLRLFAACQVLAQAWSSGGCLVVADGESPGDVAPFWASARVSAASATPSFWRQMVMTADPATLAAMPLTQITMGGEPADQALLNRLSLRFPGARVTHIYATTELGRCFAVSDGRAGFPSAWLAGGLSSPMLSVDGGELVVHTAAGPHPTGDMVTVEGDRVQFAGRRDELLNVGGEKVSPLAIEQRLRTLPEVADVRVFGRRSSIVGQLVACEVVAARGVTADGARAAVERCAQRHLAPAARPRFVDIVDRVMLTAADKAARGEEED